jgi:hypothetical protein
MTCLIRCAAFALLGFWPNLATAQDNPFAQHGKLRVAKSGTHLEHADGTPFFFLADTTWNGPALSTAADWQLYLHDRKKKGFTAIQFNAICPWRAAPTDREGRTAYAIKDGQLIPNEEYFRQLDARIKAINDAGLLAVPVLIWAHTKGDAGFDLTEAQIGTLVKFELNRYQDAHCLFILAGDARYNQTDAAKWKRIGQEVFKDYPGLLVTTHPTGMNFPWKDWEDERWLTVLGYQSGHGDDANTLQWIHSGPPAEYGRRKQFTRPLINLEPPYEDHVAYQSRQRHTAYTVRRAVYWSLLSAPVAGITYGGHGVWSWQTKPGEEPTAHRGTGVARVWKEALALPGAAQMGHVRKLFESLPWTQLRPDPNAVQQETGSTDPARYVAAARTPDSSTYVFYFPAAATAKIPLPVGSKKDAVRWFNPRTGEWLTDEKTAGRFTPPDAEDWVLVVKP